MVTHLLPNLLVSFETRMILEFLATVIWVLVGVAVYFVFLWKPHQRNNPLFIPIINKSLLDKTIRDHLIQFQVEMNPHPKPNMNREKAKQNKAEKQIEEMTKRIHEFLEKHKQ